MLGQSGQGFILLLCSATRLRLFHKVFTSNNTPLYSKVKIPPFKFGWLIFFFSCLIALARTFNTIMSRSGEHRHLCLVPDLRGKAFRFIPLSMLAMGLLNMAFIMLKYIPSTPKRVGFFLFFFYHDRISYFVKCLFCIYCNDHMILPFIPLMWHITHFFFLFFFWGGAQVWHMEIYRLGGPIRATAACLCHSHSHSNAGSQPSLQPTLQLTATLDP